jgi:hypothetical protein
MRVGLGGGVGVIIQSEFYWSLNASAVVTPEEPLVVRVT